MAHNLIYCPSDFLKDMERVILEPQTQFVEIGEFPKDIYQVLRGNAKIVHTTTRGKNIVTSHYRQGDFIGDFEVLCGQPFPFSVTALTDMILLKIPAEQFLARMKSDFRLVQSIAQSQANRINFLECYVLPVRTFPLYEQVLLYFCGKFLDPVSKDYQTKEPLMEYLATDIRSVNRILKEFAANGLVLSKDGKFIVPDPDALFQEAYRRGLGYYVEFYRDAFNCPCEQVVFPL